MEKEQSITTLMMSMKQKSDAILNYQGARGADPTEEKHKQDDDTCAFDNIIDEISRKITQHNRDAKLFPEMVWEDQEVLRRRLLTNELQTQCERVEELEAQIEQLKKQIR